MRMLVITTALAAALAFAFRPSLQGVRRAGDLVGLWAYLAAARRAWPDRKLVLEVYRSARDDELAIPSWAQPAGEPGQLAQQESEEATIEAFATEVSLLDGG